MTLTSFTLQIRRYEYSRDLNIGFCTLSFYAINMNVSRASDSTGTALAMHAIHVLKHEHELNACISKNGRNTQLDSGAFKKCLA
ncbi:hypothetical protein MTR_3g463380 [Medicago truncatula]|uniref:Uncharacterized protein n=1 Tax=Medicago truncatula TaxID=3880 RepID=A0A072UWL5_MEDTR|nr:hypothetical protein MTR_3g463380 [Medicago truncatula]